MNKTKVKKSKKRKPTITIDPALNGKYDNDPFIIRKNEQARKTIEKYGLPKQLMDRK